ncbi:BolA family protein [Denitromonas ohlonensis]|uniref:BolA family transcriptional regulator n=2 Tax=Denitromonas TaxID=139331 RepID=A0A558EYM1_9RHOO|nr:BolA family protein [Denitromonas ohlonensis]TVT50263.1 MAG: BolA family transcriptional regulator [Denitromonas halophila]TVO69238.1 BolA family transcriptional regulator [Denitromonas ohlonensis]TVO77338.1 BolA family transcriptional regulator [Denitromonas ohlonensis]TVT74934.1 MAG: BolA family transcriptional regulator [Denitromonas halophila]TVT78039.1 MAG: BolA family transcriptional regulator [Denitromonas halophila]
MSNTLAQIETRLTDALAPMSLHIDDESAQHAGHAGARDGGGHYRVDIVSAAFTGKNTVARHRLIYSALGDLMPRAIHALAIRASAPEEL